ncbi:head GIN domain-containing protein [Gilvibacter sp.]|uniref:head GIN domain-containing protein n=1 Tax=Gilvibacter sp. TaxID=2729997 RepID=UPI0025B8AF23|nr:head GIN domain-containing protein [Gilvibacter sp.]NQX77888.1 DUF2807 domain-containing protein [Gilvibacter sp.]
MRIWTLLIVLTLLSCDSENAFDCFQTNGDRIEVNYEVAAFDRIRVRERIELVLKQGDHHEVRIVAGSNLLPDISAIVEDGELILRDANACNFTRDYQPTIAYVTSPNITVVSNQSGRTVRSDGVLQYPELSLKSEDFTENDRINVDGDFDMDLEVEELRILTNNLSNFFLRGSAMDAYVQIFSGDCRIEAQELIVQNLEVFHRGTNQMFVNPQQQISGEIRSVGDVICSNTPPVVEVTEFYTGRLIFLD